MKSVRKLQEKRGFALILVFSLASIILLLSLSMVSLTQVETASNRYDQGMRVAQANARLALDMAIGDLQELAGPDLRITATADGGRSGTYIDDNFNDVTDPASNGVYQPFWTGVWNNNNANDDPIWLVTRPLDATYTLVSGTQDADPFAIDLGVSGPTELVKLVGANAAKPEIPSTGQDDYDVWVPKELVGSDKIVGLASAEEATIGHYAYWVGDSGVKASYLVEDNLPETLYDIYETSPGSAIASYENIRLNQMLAHRYFLEMESGGASPRLMDATDARLRSLVSEFAIREEINTGDSLLGNITHNDVLRRYHDFTGLSKGLLVDTVNGGLKEDLSNIHSVTTSSPADTAMDDLVNNYLMPYLNVSDFPTTTPPSDLRRAYSIAAKNTTFGGGGPTPTISPVITEFWLVVRMGAPKFDRPAPHGGLPIGPVDLGADPNERRRSNIYGQFNVSVELWNPYTSRINGADLRIRIENPNASGLEVNYYDNNMPILNNILPNFGLEDVMNDISEFNLDTTGSWWEPGEVRTFSGTFDPGTGVLDLLPGATFPEGYSYYYEITDLPTFVSGLPDDYFSDKIELIGPAWTPELTLRTSAGDELNRYTLSGISFNEMRSGIRRVFDSEVKPLLSYKWELRNPDSNWAGYDPRSGVINASLIMDSFDGPDPSPPYDPLGAFYYEVPGSTIIRYATAPIQGSSSSLLGFNDEAAPNEQNNIPFFELPRQDFLSLGALQMAEFPLGIRAHLGASGTAGSINGVFDRFFLSTVPQSSTSWTVSDPLPNSRMEPVGGVALGDLQAPDSAEYLYLDGAFNINSTSIEAWIAILKGVQVGTWTYDDPAGTTPVAGQSELDLSGESQFLRFPQSAEETWLGSYDASDMDKSRELIRKGMRSLTHAEVVTLAAEIVRAIRIRRQETTAPMGPFVSLQDFIDSGVIETAINAASINDLIRTDPGNPSTELPYASSFLTQQDVLTAIVPFLSARSDTFVVRAYGDSVNPFDQSQVVARAYCEAIVQRVHAKHASESDPDPKTATDTSAGSLGRQFKVIAFRWLTGDEI